MRRELVLILIVLLLASAVYAIYPYFGHEQNKIKVNYIAPATIDVALADLKIRHARVAKIERIEPTHQVGTNLYTPELVQPNPNKVTANGHDGDEIFVNFQGRVLTLNQIVQYLNDLINEKYQYGKGGSKSLKLPLSSSFTPAYHIDNEIEDIVANLTQMYKTVSQSTFKLYGTCSDKKKDRWEKGIDCGGICSKLCIVDFGTLGSNVDADMRIKIKLVKQSNTTKYYSWVTETRNWPSGIYCNGVGDDHPFTVNSGGFYSSSNAKYIGTCSKCGSGVALSGLSVGSEMTIHILSDPGKSHRFYTFNIKFAADVKWNPDSLPSQRNC